MSYENVPKNKDNTRVLVETDNIKAAFGGVSTVELTPITQIQSNYGLLEGVFTVLDDGAVGSTSVVDSKFTCETGVSATGLASILTLRQVGHKPGQGLVARFNAVFDTPVADSFQSAGMLSAGDSVAFSYADTNFGIVYAHGGIDELQELTLTIAAGAENATVTVNGTAYIVALSGVGTVQEDAVELAASLDTQVPNYRFSANNDQVVAQGAIPGPAGSFAYVSAGTSVGAWVQITAGVDNTNTFIPQASWNVDTKDDLDPTLGNVYQIQLQDAYFGPVDFSIVDHESGDLVLVHTIRAPNVSIDTLFSNPTFRVGWLVTNTGNTTNLTIQGASAAGFIEGRVVNSGPTRSEVKDQLAVGATLTNIISIRNRDSFGGKVNRAEMALKLISSSSQTNKVAFFEIILNPTLAGLPIFNYVDKNASLAEVSTDSVAVSGGRIIATVTVTSSGGPVLILGPTSPPIFPGDLITVAAVVPSGAASDCQSTITWQEDI